MGLVNTIQTACILLLGLVRRSHGEEATGAQELVPVKLLILGSKRVCQIARKGLDEPGRIGGTLS